MVKREGRKVAERERERRRGRVGYGELEGDKERGRET